MHERRRRRAVSLALLSALVLRVRDKPPGSSRVSSEGAGSRTRSHGVTTSVQEGRSGQQSMSDDANAPSLVVLLSASVLRGRDEPPGSSLLCSEGAGSVDVVDVVGGRSGREEEGRSEQQSTSDDADAPSLVPLLSASVLRGGDEPPGWSLLSFEGAGRVREVEAVRHCSGRVEEGRSG